MPRFRKSLYGSRSRRNRKSSRGYFKRSFIYFPRAYKSRRYSSKYRGRSSKYSRSRSRTSFRRSRFRGRRVGYLRKNRRGWYKALKPRASYQGYKINRQRCSLRYINFYADDVINRPNDSGGTQEDFMAGWAKMNTMKQLNTLACLFKRCNYIKYSDLSDRDKQAVRTYYEFYHQRLLKFKCQMLEPGAVLQKKLAKALLHEQRLSLITSNLTPLVSQMTSASFSQSRNSLNRLLSMATQSTFASGMSFGSDSANATHPQEGPMNIGEIST